MKNLAIAALCMAALMFAKEASTHGVGVGAALVVMELAFMVAMFVAMVGLLEGLGALQELFRQ